MVSWFYAEDEPPYGANVDSNRCEYFIFGRPGYHIGLSYTHGGFLKCVVWVREYGQSDVTPVVIQTPLRSNSWYNVGMVIDDKITSLCKW